MVFDSSAFLAYVRNERGAQTAFDLLDDASQPRDVHAANLCELLHQIWRSDGKDKAEATVAEFLALGIQERTDMDSELWRDAASLIAERRIAGKSLALGDALGVALARRLGVPFVTADHGELDTLEAAGVCEFIFIR